MTNTEIPEISDDIKAKCLIRTVDDDPAMREALEFMLTAEGWRVKTYENGRSFNGSIATITKIDTTSLLSPYGIVVKTTPVSSNMPLSGRQGAI